MSAETVRRLENPVSIMPEDVLLEAAGLTGWRATVRPLEETSDWVCLLTSPDYDPTTKPPGGRLFGARAADDLAAIDAAIAKVRAATQ